MIFLFICLEVPDGLGATSHPKDVLPMHGFSGFSDPKDVLPMHGLHGFSCFSGVSKGGAAACFNGVSIGGSVCFNGDSTCSIGGTIAGSAGFSKVHCACIRAGCRGVRLRLRLRLRSQPSTKMWFGDEAGDRLGGLGGDSTSESATSCDDFESISMQS